MSHRRFGLLCLGLMALVPTAAQAAFVTNGSFESPSLTGSYATYNVGSTGITGWTVVSGTNNPGGGSVDLLNSFAPAHSGTQSVDLDGTGANAAGGLTQSITGLTAGASYVLDFFAANNPNTGSASALVTIGGLSQNFSHSGSTFAAMRYTEYTYTFVATAATLALTFQSTDPATAQSGIVLDDVSINPSVVPEPASFVLVGLGVLTVAGRTHARRSRSDA